MAKLYKNFGSNSIERSISKKSTQGLTPVRVVDIILDDNHPEYAKYGYSQSIGAIKYTRLDRTIDTSDTEKLQIAYPASSTLKTLPVKNEIVLITQAPNPESTGERSTSSYVFYTTIVALWNHPAHNKAPSSKDNVNEEDRYGFPDVTNINPLQPFPGDVLVEGRLGQSIRLGGAGHVYNPLTAQDNNGSPFILLSSGQKDVGNGVQHITEDINEDPSSIYLISNHKVPLIQARSKQESIKTKTALANNYKGSQVIINSGRLFFNAKDENIGFASKGIFTVSSDSIGLDADREIGLDAKKIYLGARATREAEPVIKGDQLEFMLSTLFQLIDVIGQSMRDSITARGDSDLALKTDANVVLELNKILKRQINPGQPTSFLKSRKVFTE